MLNITDKLIVSICERSSADIVIVWYVCGGRETSRGMLSVLWSQDNADSGGAGGQGLNYNNLQQKKKKRSQTFAPKLLKCQREQKKETCPKSALLPRCQINAHLFLTSSIQFRSFDATLPQGSDLFPRRNFCLQFFSDPGANIAIPWSLACLTM